MIYVIVAVACLLVGWYGNEASRRVKANGVYRWFKEREERRDRIGYDRHKKRLRDR